MYQDNTNQGYQHAREKTGSTRAGKSGERDERETEIFAATWSLARREYAWCLLLN